MLRVSLCLFLITAAAIADDIYLKDGSIIKNVRVTGESVDFGVPVVTFTYFRLSGNIESRLAKGVISRIESAVVPDGELSTRISPSGVDLLQQQSAPVAAPAPATREDSLRIIMQQLQRINEMQNVKKTYPHAWWAAVSAVTAGLTWDFFARAGDVQDAIDINNKLAGAFNVKIDNGPLEATTTRSRTANGSGNPRSRRTRPLPAWSPTASSASRKRPAPANC